MMKNFKTRALALAGAFAFLGAGAVFGQGNDAQEGVPPGPDVAAEEDPGLDVAGGKLKIGAYVNTGFEADFNKVSKVQVGGQDQLSALPDSMKKKNSFYAYGQDADNTGRVQIDLSWTSGSKIFGAKTRLRADNIFKDVEMPDGLNHYSQGGSNSPIPKFRYAYGWWQPLKILGLSGGLVDDTAFRTDGDKGDDAIDIVHGALPGGLLHFTPVDVLDIGFGAFVDSDGSDPDDLVLSDDAAFFIGAAVKTKPVTFKGSALIHDAGFDNFLFSVSTGLVNNLSLAFEGQTFNAKYYEGAADKYGFWGDIAANYAGLGNGFVDLSFVLYFYASDWDNGVDAYYAKDTSHREHLATPVYLTINPKVYFNFLDGRVKPGLNFQVDLAKADSYSLGNIYETFSGMYIEDMSGYEIKVRPFVNFPIGGGYVEAAYEFAYYGLKGTSNTLDVKAGTTRSTIYFDFLFRY